ncbi:MAG: hypothetical protein ACI8PZ_002460 [Myxococcota bacterium]|jgi:hypothetical protein
MSTRPTWQRQLRELYGRAEPAAPIVVYVPGALDDAPLRHRFIETLRRAYQRANAVGSVEALDGSLDLVLDAMSANSCHGNVVVARAAGDRPFLWCMPPPATDEAFDEPMVYIGSTLPAWLHGSNPLRGVRHDAAA